MAIKRENWPLKVPFVISGHVFEALDVVVVELASGGLRGRGEAAGVYYRGDDVDTIVHSLDSNRAAIERGVNRREIQQLLPAGGARNALDCALWDLEAKRSNEPAWRTAGLRGLQPLQTVYTCGAGTPVQMSEAAKGFRGVGSIKLKLTGDPEDADRVVMVRRARPDVWLCVDANQGLDPETFRALLPVLIECDVRMVEQPFPIGKEYWLDEVECPLPIAADESVQCIADIPSLAGRFSMINIKLDKCGGLTEGLAMARQARQQGLGVMVGNMMGTSLAMAPAFLLGQLCDVVDVDGPILLAQDRLDRLVYDRGRVDWGQLTWGT